MKTPNARRGLLAVALLAAWATGANAAVFRAYLSPAGNDANPCTLSAPCRLLPAALAAVQSGGEIWMLDSANYNTAPVTINKSVTILSVPGALGSVVAAGGNAINITAPGLDIVLRNLVMVPLLPPSGGIQDGIRMTASSNLAIEDCLIANMPNSALYVTNAGSVKITGSTLRGNADMGVFAQDGANVMISNSKLLQNTNLNVAVENTTASTTTVDLSDSVISGGSVGVYAVNSVAGSAARIVVTRSTIDATVVGVASDGAVAGALITINASSITNNDVGWFRDGSGIIKTMGNNHIQENNSSSGPLTPAIQQ